MAVLESCLGLCPWWHRFNKLQGVFSINSLIEMNLNWMKWKSQFISFQLVLLWVEIGYFFLPCIFLSMHSVIQFILFLNMQIQAQWEHKEVGVKGSLMLQGANGKELKPPINQNFPDQELCHFVTKRNRDNEWRWCMKLRNVGCLYLWWAKTVQVRPAQLQFIDCSLLLFGRAIQPFRVAWQPEIQQVMIFWHGDIVMGRRFGCWICCTACKEPGGGKGNTEVEMGY